MAFSISVLAGAATIGLVHHEIITRGPWTGIAVGFGLVIFAICFIGQLMELNLNKRR